jgi:hypothetical protein
MPRILDGDQRYAANWPKIRAKAHALVGRRCCWRGPTCEGASEEVHHVHYWVRGVGAIAGRERPGVDVFPVCSTCHTALHAPHVWAEVPDLEARTNTPKAIAQLTANWQILAGETHGTSI